MKLSSFLILTIFTITRTAHDKMAQNTNNLPSKSPQSDVKINTHKSKKNLKLSFGFILISNTSYRGALTYDAPLIFVGPRIILFNKLEFKGRGFVYTESFKKRHKLSTSIYYFNDEPPKGPVILLKNQEEKSYRNARRGTWDASIRYTYKYKRLFDFSLDYHKNIKGQSDNYIAVGFSTGIFKYVTFKVEFGIGDKASNKYAYGPEGVSGLGHINYSLSSFFPILPWRGRLIPSYTVSTIQQKQNQNADFVRGENINDTFNIVFSWKIQ